MWRLSWPNQRIHEFLNRLPARYRSFKRADVLTGFLGLGARVRLERLGVKHARIVIGMDRPERIVARSLVRSINGLTRDNFAEVRVSRGLHAKLYIFDQRFLVFGSANLTCSGFETLREVVVATDVRRLVVQARSFFERVWMEQDTVKPKFQPARRGVGGARETDPIAASLGTHFSRLSVHDNAGGVAKRGSKRAPARRVTSNHRAKVESFACESWRIA